MLWASPSVFYRRDPVAPRQEPRPCADTEHADSRNETSFLMGSAAKCRVRPDFGFLAKGSASPRGKLEQEKKATMEVRLFLR